MAKSVVTGFDNVETVFRNAATSQHLREMIEAELATYASLAEQEAPGNLYSADLFMVLRMLERGLPLDKVLAEVRRINAARQ